jgi:hypothetical protein
VWTPQREPSATISRTHVRYPEAVTERPRIALRQPRSLQPEQLGQLSVSTLPSRSGSAHGSFGRTAWRNWCQPRRLPEPKELSGSGLELHPISSRSGYGQGLSSEPEPFSQPTLDAAARPRLVLRGTVIYRKAKDRSTTTSRASIAGQNVRISLISGISSFN